MHIITKDLARRSILYLMAHYRKLKGLPPLNNDTTLFNYTLVTMIENHAYVGELVSQTTAPSYKNHGIVKRPKAVPPQMF
ncbi:MAG: hypothetical protein LBR74_09000 [Eubacterium sp.]|jgi:hypothetical protein|nr:hypothetical protein [Eubacterium sp.]